MIEENPKRIKKTGLINPYNKYIIASFSDIFFFLSLETSTILPKYSSKAFLTDSTSLSAKFSYFSFDDLLPS